MSKKKLFCILANENEEDHHLWRVACDTYSSLIKYDVINITKNDWLDKFADKEYHYFLARPPGLSMRFKNLYDERIYLISKFFNTPIYPTPSEIYIYENKRLLYSWLKASNTPHPETHVFYNKAEAIYYLNNAKMPIVAKTNIGASGSGVRIFTKADDAIVYLNTAFSIKGITRRWGPNLAKGSLLKRGAHYLRNPKDISKKVKRYKEVKAEIQKDYVIFQEYVPHDFEWRVVAIGDSYFAHKKLKMGQKASGSTIKKYDNPPTRLFDFTREIMKKHGFVSQAFDLFETKNGILLINEMQCMFGQSDPYQMLVDGSPGRYRYLNNNWVFEEGDFNKNQSYNLRLENVLSLINSNENLIR